MFARIEHIHVSSILMVAPRRVTTYADRVLGKLAVELTDTGGASLTMDEIVVPHELLFWRYLSHKRDLRAS
jgi:hypothetical protein